MSERTETLKSMEVSRIDMSDLADLDDTVDFEEKMATGGKKTFKLKNIHFRAKKHELTMIVGKIGSGKSSLLYSLLGEMKPLTVGFDDSNIVNIDSSISYLGQEPWLMNDTVRQNILLNLPYKEEKYEKAVYYSALKQDLDSFPLGDQKIVGNDGNTISGGQKARIALARCLYQDSEIYLLDDIMSALDAKVGAFINEETILKYLIQEKKKTVVLVTHAMQYIKYSDYIYTMDEGKIVDHGNFDDFKERDEVGLYKKFLELEEVSLLNIFQF
jgi:ATP-binding cassette subfamily C (CFTR/MRP) protein 1